MTMIKELRFALYAIRKNIQSSAELRTSFIANIIGMMINNSAFIILWIFFVRSVGVINGWDAADIVGLLGFGTLSYGIVFSAAAGIRKMPGYVANGTFDRFMLSPKNLIVRASTADLNVSAIGDIVFGIITLSIYAVLIQASIVQIALAVAMAIASTVIFFSAALAISAASFLFVDGNSVTSSIFEFFITPTMFHGGAFQGALRFVFTFIVPSLAIGALPVEAVRNISTGTALIVWAMAGFWSVFSIWIFNKAVRKYESANFMTFGG